MVMLRAFRCDPHFEGPPLHRPYLSFSLKMHQHRALIRLTLFPRPVRKPPIEAHGHSEKAIAEPSTEWG